MRLVGKLVNRVSCFSFEVSLLVTATISLKKGGDIRIGYNSDLVTLDVIHMLYSYPENSINIPFWVRGTHQKGYMIKN